MSNDFTVAREKAKQTAIIRGQMLEQDLWWVLKDLVVATLPKALSKGAYNRPGEEPVDLVFGPPDECAASVLRYAKATLKLLVAELPEHMRVPTAKTTCTADDPCDWCQRNLAVGNPRPTPEAHQ